ncbi:DUF523 domain-containing protein [Niallia endozanthoxylica]|uniref:DUF523 domain-containing protein n=1 Tax=Niallia endozanthoxylica TaxID=2036016 RepID=A0A5J5HM16_9BACI|nr:DUF523 domain-containing protein [Niallia endozanthoxylica]KAA9021815.1 DUF523 domain-containing protein [Niallia endozanthoxylica]
MIVVSACFAGFDVKYNGSNNVNLKIKKLFDEKKAIPVCPEVMGGLSIPREPAEIVGGDGDDVLDGRAKVMTNTSKDVTEQFLKGAYDTLKTVKEVGASVVVLKERSPSCGSTMIYSGEFNGSKRPGNGVTAALLKRNGIRVVSEENFLEYLEEQEL